MTPQPLPDTIPLSEAHTYLPQLHQAGVSTPALPDEIPLNDAHSYLPQIMHFGTSAPAALPQANTPSGPQLSGDKNANQALIAQMGAAYFGADEVAPLLAIVRSESGFNDKAANKTSSARGLFQMLSSTARNYGLPDDASQATPEQQVQAGLAYIKQRYQTPSQGLAFHKEHGWY